MLAGGAGLVSWKALRDPDIAWLSREGRATWIRYPSPAATRASFIVRMTTEFRTSFPLEAVPEHAFLRIRFFRSGVLRLNGQEVDLRHCTAPWKEACRTDVAPLLRPGRNVLEASVAHASALPALWLEITGPGVDVRSDATWDSSLAGASWRRVVPASEPPGAPRTDPFDPPPPPLQALAAKWGTLAGAALLSVAVLAMAAAWSRRRRSRGAAGPLPWSWIAMVGVGLAWIALFVNQASLLPLDWGFDATAHLDYVAYILERHALPMPDEGWSMFHPPLYYAILAGVLRLAGTSPAAQDAAVWIRAVGLGIGLGNLVIVTRLIQRAVPDDPRGQVVGVLVAGCLPVMIYLHQFPTNELLLALLSSVVILLAHDTLQDGSWALAKLALLGAVVGLALLTKFTAFLLVPPVAGVFLYRAITGPRSDVARRLGALAVAGLAAVAVSGWHYGRIWARFGTPFVTGWENRPGLGWWVDPGYRTLEHFTRFGRVFVQPLFAGYDSLWDGLYSTMWGDGLMSGLAAATPWPPWWSPSLQAGGYLLALVPSALILVGFLWTAWRWVRAPGAGDALLLGVSSVTLLAMILMTVRVPCVAQDKASYGLVALGPLAVFAARGLGVGARAARWLGPALLVAIGTWALTSFATYRVDRSSENTRVTRAMQSDLAGDRRGAIAELRQVVAARPSDWRARLALARILLEKGGSGAEVERLVLPSEREPDLAPRHLAIALWRGSRGDFPGAAEAARRTIALDPDGADAWAVLASALEAQGDASGAVDAWQEVLRIQPQDRAAHEALASLLSRKGRESLAAMHLDYARRIPVR